MPNRLSALYSRSSRPSGTLCHVDSNESKVSTIANDPDHALQPPSLIVKRVDYYYSRWSKSWKYRNTSSKIAAETIPFIKSGENDPWKGFLFVVVRTVPRNGREEPSFKIIIKSAYLLKALKDVVQSWPGISWNSDPPELNPEIIVTFHEQLTEYRDNLLGGKHTEVDKHVLSSVNVLLSAFKTDYKSTFSTLDSLKAHREITFDHLYAILVPRTLFVTRCANTGQPRLFKLRSFQRTCIEGIVAYVLECESVDLIDKSMSQTVSVGRVQHDILLKYFKGTMKMDNLDAYPLKYHSDPEGLKKMVAQRGRKWDSLTGTHQKQFDGIAASRCIGAGGEEKLVRHSVKGRIMVDRLMFRKMNPNYNYPVAAANNMWASAVPTNGWASVPDLPASLPLPPPLPPVGGYANGTLVSQRYQGDGAPVAEDSTEEDYLLASTVVYGFSLTDKLWLEFDVTKVQDVEWNNEAFRNLVLPTKLKTLLQSLVEAHHRELGFDDFIRGKGHGLVVNLFGPPGVGKTFSAEATSEHVKRPLYVVGAGDLGPDPSSLSDALSRVFEVAAAWKAIVLIDEADVFLEQRSLHDLDRNAMVAVFLRHIEYYRGVLFLTTNRVKAFDEAFLSRIHVALHFRELSVPARAQVWRAFIRKLGLATEITDEQVEYLAKKNVNGRQIKNAARTAHSLAVGMGEKLEFRHFVDTLEAMDSFTKEFGQLREGAVIDVTD